MKEISEEGIVLRNSLLSTQVCVLKTWTDEQVLNFVERETHVELLMVGLLEERAMRT